MCCSQPARPCPFRRSSPALQPDVLVNYSRQGLQELSLGATTAAWLSGVAKGAFLVNGLVSLPVGCPSLPSCHLPFLAALPSLFLSSRPPLSSRLLPEERGGV